MSSIFISHSSKDNQQAERVKGKLTDAGYRSIFLDFDIRSGIKSGELWEEVLYDRLKRCQALIVLCSEDSVKSDWCLAEIAFARALGKHIFPVRLDKCRLPRGLSDRQRTDIALGENELDEAKQAETFERLLLGLGAAGLAPKDTFDWDDQDSPYPGLASFDMKEAAIYFGREGKIEEGLNLLNELRTIRGVLVLGASGSGKSSLVKAGLLPRLKRDQENWAVLNPFRPGLNPMLQFRGAVSVYFKERNAAEQGRALAEVLGDQKISPKRRAEAFINGFDELDLSADRPYAKPLMTIDQLEELLRDDAQELAKDFLGFLVELLKHPNSKIRVIVTLRSDFLGRFQTHPILRQLSFKTLMVNPLELEALPRVIEGPAERVGVKLETGLCQQLVKDTQDGNALPLLAHTLQKLWKRYKDECPDNISWLEYKKAFDIKAVFYEDLGRLAGSIAQTANDLLEGYAPASDEARRQQVEAELRRAFLKLVRITDGGGKAVRRLAAWEELPESIHPLLQDFIGEEGRLLRLSQEVMGKEGQLLNVSDKVGLVEVSHEALFTAWPLLEKWIGESREHLVYTQKLEAIAAEWQAEQQPKLLLLTGERLEIATDFVATYGEDFPLNAVGQAFVEASQRANAMQNFFKQTRSTARSITSRP